MKFLSSLIVCFLILTLPANALTATFYANRFNGRLMANGKRFSQHRYTAAHPNIRLGKVIKVTNKKTGKTIRVTVTDRCYCSLDLSKSAFLALGGKLKQGRIPVSIR